MDDDEKTTIYVGNLPQQVTSQDLYGFLSTFGEIRSVDIPLDHNTQRQRGFAFVEFDEKDDADAAIDNYDKADFMGRTVRIRRARPLDSKPDYHGAVWSSGNWLQKIENDKIQKSKLTQQQQDQNKRLGLPVYKEAEIKQDQKPLVYVEND